MRDADRCEPLALPLDRQGHAVAGGPVPAPSESRRPAVARVSRRPRADTSFTRKRAGASKRFRHRPRYRSGDPNGDAPYGRVGAARPAPFAVIVFRVGRSVRRGRLRAAACSLIVSVMSATIRVYEPRDLSSILRLWEQLGSVPVGSDGLRLDQAVELISSGSASTLVAERDGEVVAVAAGSVAAGLGWIYRLSVSPDGDVDGLAQQLLSELELKLAEGGARKLTTSVREASAPLAAFERYGYRATSEMRYLERELPAIGVSVPAALEELGAHLIHPGLWEELRGLDEAKQIIERRVILPLAEPQLAARHAVVAAQGDRPVRPSWHRQDDVCQGHRFPSGVAVCRDRSSGDRCRRARA